MVWSYQSSLSRRKTFHGDEYEAVKEGQESEPFGGALLFAMAHTVRTFDTGQGSAEQRKRTRQGLWKKVDLTTTPWSQAKMASS